MDAVQAWHKLFTEWPSSVPREGMVVTVTDTIPFIRFMAAEGLVLLERDRPDALGARKVMVPYGCIIVVKLTSPAELSTYCPLGFQPPRA